MQDWMAQRRPTLESSSASVANLGVLCVPFSKCHSLGRRGTLHQMWELVAQEITLWFCFCTLPERNVLKLVRQTQTDLLSLCRQECLDWSFDFRCDLMRVSAVSLECVQGVALYTLPQNVSQRKEDWLLLISGPIFSPAWLLLGPLKLFTDVFVKLGKKEIKTNDAQHRLMSLAQGLIMLLRLGTQNCTQWGRTKMWCVCFIQTTHGLSILSQKAGVPSLYVFPLFFLWLNSTQLCVYVCLCVYHIFFTHPPTMDIQVVSLSWSP